MGMLKQLTCTFDKKKPVVSRTGDSAVGPEGAPSSSYSTEISPVLLFVSTSKSVTLILDPTFRHPKRP